MWLKAYLWPDSNFLIGESGVAYCHRTRLPSIWRKFCSLGASSQGGEGSSCLKPLVSQPIMRHWGFNAKFSALVHGKWAQNEALIQIWGVPWLLGLYKLDQHYTLAHRQIVSAHLSAISLGNPQTYTEVVTGYRRRLRCSADSFSAFDRQ